MRRHSATASLFAALPIASTLLISSPATAQQPAGWVGNGHISAYTLQPGEFELSGRYTAVNDTLDVLDLRADVLSRNSRLAGKSGDLDGSGLDVRVGVWRGLEVFYRRMEQDLTLEIAADARVDILDLDSSLRTTRQHTGARWVIYEQRSAASTQPWTSVALQAEHIDNRSRDFGGRIASLQLDANINIRLDPPQRFDLNRLGDDGWAARLIVSQGLTPHTTVSYWVGYSDMDSSSGTATEIEQTAINRAFLQTFDIQEKYLHAGLAMNWQRIPRLPVQLSYEYTRIQDRQTDIVSSNSTLLPGFLRGGNMRSTADNNHVLRASATWWITPHIYAGAGGTLLMNQYTGIMPHFNNPLSASFSDITYGYAEIRLGFSFHY